MNRILPNLNLARLRTASSAMPAQSDHGMIMDSGTAWARQLGPPKA